jgi:hypothetical protein
MTKLRAYVTKEMIQGMSKLNYNTPVLDQTHSESVTERHLSVCLSIFVFTLLIIFMTPRLCPSITQLDSFRPADEKYRTVVQLE